MGGLGPTDVAASGKEGCVPNLVKQGHIGEPTVFALARFTEGSAHIETLGVRLRGIFG